MSFFYYVYGIRHQIGLLFIEHIQLTLIAVFLAILLGVPMGILISFIKKICKPVLGAVNIIQAIPSLALLGICIPLLGIGKLPAIIVVMLYSLLPIVKNTFTGLDNINEDTVEAAQGMGLTGFQILTRVQIPLALPVIMAGVRIAAVTAVGLMTIAAYIGAGGLGFLVFSGISRVDNNQILSGAIPACILALLVDFTAGQIEKRVSPSFKVRKGKSRARKERSASRLVVCGVLGLALLFGGYLYLSEVRSSKNVIVVGGKDFTEQFILTYLVGNLLEDSLNVTVVKKPNLGGTQVCFNALKTGELDLYIEYTGTAYADTLGYKPITDVKKVYETVKNDFREQFGIAVLREMRFNNTYTLSTTKKIADQYGLKKISDLRGKAEHLGGGFTFEFFNRDDGLPNLQKHYDFRFKGSKAITGSLRYVALDNDEVQIIDAFATDGLLKKFSLITLEDDKDFFPPYYAIPVVREEVLEAHGEMIPQLERLGELLTNESIATLNYQVDELQRDPEEVAMEFLRAHNLIKEKEPPSPQQEQADGGEK